MGMRHFDVQMIGGMVLHSGAIAEMRTGEGKTLTGTLAVVLNTLARKGVHVVTVNDYLARRDAEWMSPIYRFLGLEVGVLQNQMAYEPKRAAYARSEEHTSELQSRQYLHSFPTRRSSDLAPARARRGRGRSPSSSTPSRARASTWSRSTTTSPAATRSGCRRSTGSSASRSASCRTRWPTSPSGRRT